MYPLFRKKTPHRSVALDASFLRPAPPNIVARGRKRVRAAPRRTRTCSIEKRVGGRSGQAQPGLGCR